MKNHHALIYLLTLSLGLLPAQAAQEDSKEKEKDPITSATYKKYTHGGLQDYEKIMDEIDKNEPDILDKELFKLYQNGVAKPLTQKTKDRRPVYFVLGPTGSGKSTFIYACQGNEITKKQNETGKKVGLEKAYKMRNKRSKENKSEPFEFIKRIQGDTPKIAASAEPVTFGSKIYYSENTDKPMAFCDTEGFLGERNVNNETEKLIAAFSPYFTLKTNKIGGIVILVSAADIDSGRGKNFEASAAFIKNYFTKGLMYHKQALKKSVIMVITKEKTNTEDEQVNLLEQIGANIQKAYKDYFTGMPVEDDSKLTQIKNAGGAIVQGTKDATKYLVQKILTSESSATNTQEAKGDLAHLKDFYGLFLKKEISKDEINNIENFDLDIKKIHFFYPYDNKNVEETRSKLLDLQPMPHSYLSTRDNLIVQYLTKKIIDKAYQINQTALGVLEMQELVRLQNIIADQRDKELEAYTKQLKDKKENLQNKNELILEDELLETVYEDSHDELNPYYYYENKVKGYFKYVSDTYKKELYEEVYKKFFVKQTTEGALGLLLSPLTVISVPVCCLLPFSKNNIRLRKFFVYTGEEPICRIEIYCKHAHIKWIKPDIEFIKNHFDLTKTNADDKGGVWATFTSKNLDAITLPRWEVYHVTDYGKNADCEIYFSAKKKNTKASAQKIEDNKQKIEYIDTYLARIDEDKAKDKLKIKQELVCNEGILQKERAKLNQHQEELDMIYFWSTHMAESKLTSKELIVQHRQNYQEATGIKLKQYEGYPAIMPSAPERAVASTLSYDDEKEADQAVDTLAVQHQEQAVDDNSQPGATTTSVVAAGLTATMASLASRP